MNSNILRIPISNIGIAKIAVIHVYYAIVKNIKIKSNII